MILAQEFLKNKTFGDLKKEHGVAASFSSDGLFFSLNYSQIESKDNDLLAQQCRGVILTNKYGKVYNFETINNCKNYNDICPGETIIVAHPFYRFFNLGQEAASKIDFNDKSLKIYDKADGTLIICWKNIFSNKFEIATRSVPFADIQMENGNTFRSLFEKILYSKYKISFNEFAASLDENITYMFELVSRYNRIVVDYDEPNILFIGARNNISGKEYDIQDDIFNHQLPKINRIKTFNFLKLEDILSWVSSQNPLEHEGIVVKDSNFNRIKIKNASYVALNKCRDFLSASQRNCLELILAEKEDDVIPTLPQEIVDNLLSLKDKLIKTIHYYDQVYQEALKEANLIEPGSKKTFAQIILVKDDIWTAPLFQIFDKKAHNMRDFIIKNKKNGTWSNLFLDKLLSIFKKF